MPSTILSLPSVTVTVGTSTFGPLTVTAGTTQLAITITPAAWGGVDHAECISFELDLSTDGGTTWITNYLQFGITDDGAINTKTGLPYTTRVVTLTNLRAPSTVRGRIVVAITKVFAVSMVIS